MEYNPLALKLFIKDRLGKKSALYEPKIDRLVVLYCEFNNIRLWLEKNQYAVGKKEYKDMVACLNAMMQNIRNIEDDIGLFNEKSNEHEANPLVDELKELSKWKQ